MAGEPAADRLAGPVRTCVGCRRRAGQTELIRLVWDGQRLAVSRTAPGRGAWLHPDPACLTAASRKGGLSRAFRAPIPVSEVDRLGERPWAAA